MVSNYFRLEGWHWYLSSKSHLLNPRFSGKWMAFFSNQELAMKICHKAVDEGACLLSKCTDKKSSNSDNVAICFYINGDDYEAHKKLLSFMINNNLIRRTKDGRLYDIGFKYDFQTIDNEYDDSYESILHLSDLIDLNYKNRQN